MPTSESRSPWGGDDRNFRRSLAGGGTSVRGVFGATGFTITTLVVFLVGVTIIGVAAWFGVGHALLADCLLAGLCCLSGSMVGHIPLMLLRQSEVDRLPAAIFLGMVLRSSVAVITVVALIVSGTVNPTAAAFSFFAWYTVYLSVDVIHGVRAISRSFPDVEQRSENSKEASTEGRQ